MGKRCEEHKERLERAIKRATESNVEFSLKKCKFAKSDVKYMGNIFSQNGISLDEDRLKAVKDIKSPTNKK